MAILIQSVSPASRSISNNGLIGIRYKLQGEQYSLKKTVKKAIKSLTGFLCKNGFFKILYILYYFHAFLPLQRNVKHFG
jgi:membrane-anchored glycerophosphoryl diester phosphodiesterase (GDPDase)